MAQQYYMAPAGMNFVRCAACGEAFGVWGLDRRKAVWCPSGHRNLVTGPLAPEMVGVRRMVRQMADKGWK